MTNQTSLTSTTVICRLSYFFLLFSLRRSFKHYCGFSPWKVFRISKCLCFCLGRNFQERVNSKNVKYLGIPGLHFHQKSPYLCSCWTRTFSLSVVAGLRGEGPPRRGGPDWPPSGRTHRFPPLGKNGSAGGWRCQVDGDSHAQPCAPGRALLSAPPNHV